MIYRDDAYCNDPVFRQIYRVPHIANTSLNLNLNNYFRFQSLHLCRLIEVSKPFTKMTCENQFFLIA